MKPFPRLVPLLLLVSSPAALAICQPQPECEATNTPPSVTLTSPANGATSAAPGSFTLTANATDDSNVDSVEFFSNNVSVGIDSSAPYSILLTGLATGTYQIKAKATDDTAKTASSAIWPAAGFPDTQFGCDDETGGGKWPAAGFPDTQFGCDDETGGGKWQRGCLLASSSLRR